MSGTTVTMMDRYSGSRVKRTKNADVDGRLNALASRLVFKKYFNGVWEQQKISKRLNPRLIKPRF